MQVQSKVKHGSELKLKHYESTMKQTLRQSVDELK